MMDFARARRTMVDTQIRVNDVTDSRIVDALMAVPRENFVPDALRLLAYLDDDLAVKGEDGSRGARYLVEPMVLARMIQAATIGTADRVLDVGSATGYSSAVLGRIAGSVVALEEDTELAAQARAALGSEPHVTVVEGSLAAGAADRGPFDVILLQGAAEVVPLSLLAQLNEGGRLVAVVGTGRAAKCMVHVRIGQEFSVRPAFDAAIPLLPGFAEPRGFVF
ncbi:MAG: protein-L-isoaspartate O-methyltransferase [Phreatobacter sp.]|uniref:protein-L-isoaspartate O-methyltransferase family protein n=1 Tax=Phreatobacter sp. TaxID=1966341 RepID=UPI002734E107|nr:protein-L-isoaspartate O-methyltransferase [Phreatobacter sp.]MDP2801253.1 protein-L-isoaspartate O-methyltransferase [Phreatobacter sp.]